MEMEGNKESADLAKKLLDNANTQCIKSITTALKEASDSGCLSYYYKTTFTSVVLGN